MKAELLKILRDTDGYVSGQQLCRHFNVSRTSVWKTICQLREEGYLIEAVQNRGYRLQESPELMSGAEVRSRLHTRWMGRECICLETVDSTNTYARRLAEEGAADGTLVLAEEQTGGKGRRGRNWSSPRGEQIAMTLLLRPKIRPEHASRMTLLMALAAARGIRRICGLESKIKWPNDLVSGDKKICGILAEMNTEVDYIHYVVIGTGINVNQTEFPEELRKTASSLRLETGRSYSRAELAACIMDELEPVYETFLKTEDLRDLYQEYNELCVNCGRQVRVLHPKGAYTGTAEGINQNGELLVRREDGTVEQVYAGEVSVRGLYGYT